jgi:hypothetical protein
MTWLDLDAANMGSTEQDYTYGLSYRLELGSL